MTLLAGKVALVTGSSRGLGAGIARAFANQGAAVALHGRNKDALAATGKSIAAAGGRVLELTAELTQPTEIDAMRDQIEAELGPIDIVVSNAGNNFLAPGPIMAVNGPIEEMTASAWNATIEANLTTAFLTIKSILPGMKARRSGNIIAMSSVAARRPHARAQIAYSVAKAGLELLVQNVARQAGPYGVRANCIAPATIMTQRNAAMPPEGLASLAELYPLRRLGTIDDVALAAVYLASEQSSWITGIVLDVAGGMVMRR